jgi:hypothetical protein
MSTPARAPWGIAEGEDDAATGVAPKLGVQRGAGLGGAAARVGGLSGAAAVTASGRPPPVYPLEFADLSS